MTYKKTLILLCFLCFMLCRTSLLPAEEPQIALLPQGEQLYSDYTVIVNGQNVPVYSCRVSAYPINQTWPGYQRPLDQTELAGFAYWEMSDKVFVEIKTKTKPEKVTVRPLSLGIESKQVGNSITFTLDKVSPIVVEFNDYHHALHLFPYTDQKEPVDKKKVGLHYFGPGVHQVGVLNLKDNESVYIAAGAVVYGSIHGYNVSNIRVEGPGILDASQFERYKGGGCLCFEKCKNIHIDGLIMRDPDVWTVNIFDCDDVVMKNSRLVGLWRYNSDGIDVCNSRNVLVENCFVCSFDDSLVVKGLPRFKTKPNKNITFRGCVVWCDWGRALEIGAETCTPEDDNIIFEDCDVIRTTNIAMDVQHYDEAFVHNIRFENIRAEFDDWIPRELYQNAKDMKYVVNKNDKYCSRLMVIVLPSWRAPWSSEKHGTAKNIIFKNITIYASRMPPSSFSGYDKDHNVDGVTVEKVRFHGKEPAKNAQELNLKIESFVDNVKIIP